MSTVQVDYTGFMDSYPVASGTVTTGWYPGNIGKLESDGELTLYSGGTTEDAMFLVVDDTNELSSPPTGKRVTVLYGQGKVQIKPDDVTDWSNVYYGPLTDWLVNLPVYATNAGTLCVNYNATPDAGSGVRQVGKVVDPPTAANSYYLTMLVTV